MIANRNDHMLSHMLPAKTKPAVSLFALLPLSRSNIGAHLSLASFALDKIGIVVIVGAVGSVGQKPAIIALLFSDALVFLLGEGAFGHVVGDFCLGFIWRNIKSIQILLLCLIPDRSQSDKTRDPRRILMISIRPPLIMFLLGTGKVIARSELATCSCHVYVSRF